MISSTFSPGKTLGGANTGLGFLLKPEKHMMHLHTREEKLKRVYVEVTNRCNLNCRTCIRNTCIPQAGSMGFEIFQELLHDLDGFKPFPEVFFGGYGEPLSHPRILEMITAAGRKGANTSLITNGTLLTPPIREGLIAAGLDRLWVSLDGAYPESYQDIRLGGHLPQIIENLEKIQDTKDEKPALGIALVLMKRNAADLPALLTLCAELEADTLFITHLEAYDESLTQEILYRNGVTRKRGQHSSRDEVGEWIGRDLETLLAGDYPFRISGSLLESSSPICPFVEEGAAVVRWDGAVSPCLPLLYEHTSFTPSWERRSVPYLVGSIQEQAFPELWFAPRYRTLRDRLHRRSFSPCVTCRDCWLSSDNLQDCMGYEHPTCGGCLWAEGWINCP